MTSEGGFRAILLGTGSVLPRRSCLECRGWAGEVGTSALQVTFVGSDSTSYARWTHPKKSDSIPSPGGKVMACDRYKQEKVNNLPMNRKVSISLLIYSLRSYLRVRWVPRPKAHLLWRVKEGSERSCSEQVQSCPGARAWNAEVLQGKLVPWPCKWPPRVLIRPPVLDECIERGPTQFRSVPGEIRPLTGT